MIKLKYTLSSQEYNEIFRNAAETFDNEMAKRDTAIRNMSTKLKIINYTNEFIEKRLLSINSSIDYNKKLVTFDNDIGGTYNQFGYVIHPKFKREPIDIFNLRLMSGGSMFKNSIKCRINIGDELDKENGVTKVFKDNEMYINFLMSDNSPEKELIFDKIYSDTLTIEYTLNSAVSLGTMRFNIVEIDPFIYGAYSLNSIEFYSLDSTSGAISETPIKTVYSINNLGKTRIILDEKIKFSKVVFRFDLSASKTQEDNIDVFPFGLKHIYFYEADFLEDSMAIIPIRSSDFIEYIYNDITLYHAGEPIQTTTDYYGIEFYTDFVNNTLTGRVYASSDAAAYRIAKNTKVIYAKVPLIWINEANKQRQYLSLSGILFNYVTEETMMI